VVRRTRFYWFRPVSMRLVNRFPGPIAPHLPTFALVRYRGRTSGRAYEIPVNVFRDRARGEWFMVLTYGSDAQWVKNILAAGEAEITTGGRTMRLADPRLDRYEPESVPLPVRLFSGLAGVSEVLRLREVG
jgi:deazaflavin-dependent oxidoreductase (nitroreductase family)